MLEQANKSVTIVQICQRLGPRMRYLKWLSIVVAALYIVVPICLFVLGRREGGFLTPDLFEMAAGLFLWLGVSLGCIWYADELGESLVGAKFGLVSSSSPGWAVEVMGWILLLLPGAAAIVQHCMEE